MTVKKLSVKMANATSRYIIPVELEKRIYRNNFSGFITQNNELSGCCCNCKEKFCISYNSKELHSDFFNSFPHNTSHRVCPTDAISISGDNAVIDGSKCIGCGICLHRCPFSAFALNTITGKCFVQDNKIRVSDSIASQERQIEKIHTLPCEISYFQVSVPFINDNSLQIINNTDSPEIIVRNFLINLHFPANVNAQGNQHNRIEFFALIDEKFLIGECETNNDVLSVSRRILDDLAVLVSRYSISLEDIIPLAVINRLPNKRTDFYEVIEDIKKVIGVQINTISYACLFFLNLFKCKMSVTDFQNFFLNRKETDLAIVLNQYISNFSGVCSYFNSEYFSVQK